MDEDLSGGQSPIPLNFTTVAIGIAAAVMVFGAIRGVVKLIFTLAALACGSVVAYMAWLKLPEFSSQLETPFTPRMLAYACIAIGILTYIFSRIIIGKILNPLALINGKPRGGGLIGAVFGLVPAAALVWVIVTAVRVTGVVESFEHTREELKATGGTVSTDAPWLARLKNVMESDTIARWMAKLDPFVEKGKESLAKLLVSSQDRSTAHQLHTNSDTSKILSDPKVLALLKDPEIRKLIDRGEYLTLMENKKLREAVESPALQDSLQNLEIDKELENAHRRRRLVSP